MRLLRYPFVQVAVNEYRARRIHLRHRQASRKFAAACAEALFGVIGDYSMPAPALYADLSQYYDLLCSAIDYNEQGQFALRAHRLFGNGGQRYLDLACGSGAHLAVLQNAGFCCAGLDISQAMLDLAAKRVPQAQLYLQDMSELNPGEPLDFITCFLYSLHYSHPMAKFEQTLQHVFAALAPGGLFCFDAVDKNQIANDAGHSHSMHHQQHLLHFQTRWHYPGHGDTLKLHVHIRDQQQVYHEQHTMSALSIGQIERALTRAGFTVAILERDFHRLLPWQGHTGNVIFCAWKDSDEQYN